jgi:hypothetical protein
MRSGPGAQVTLTKKRQAAWVTYCDHCRRTLDGWAAMSSPKPAPEADRAAPASAGKLTPDATAGGEAISSLAWLVGGPGKVFQECVQRIRGMQVVHAPYQRPPPKATKEDRGLAGQLRPGGPDASECVIPDAVDSATGEARFTPGEFWDKANQLPNPYGARVGGLPPDLCEAAAFLVERHRSFGDVPAWRAQRWGAFQAIAWDLRHLDERLRALMPEPVARVARPIAVGLVACLIDALRWPDVDLPRRLTFGFDIVGDIASSNLFRPCEQPASVPFADFVAGGKGAVDRIAALVERKATAATARGEGARVRAAYELSLEEVVQGLARGPLPRSEVERGNYGSIFPIPRSAITKGVSSFRAIDDARASGHNDASTLHETITCVRADLPALIAEQVASLYPEGGAPATLTGSDDIKSAYRQFAVKDTRFSLVAVWNPAGKCVSYFQIYGHNFGLKASVVNFNRWPALVVRALRTLFAVLLGSYYDDYSLTEPDWTVVGPGLAPLPKIYRPARARASGQAILWAFHAKLGVDLSVPKHINLAPTNPFLGIESDLSSAHLDGVVRLRVSECRRDRVCALIQRHTESGTLGRAEAASLRGKLLFSACPCFGKVGKAALRVLAWWQYRPRGGGSTRDSLFPGFVAAALEFFRELVASRPVAELHIWPRSDPPVVMLTDAMQEGPRVGIGFVASYPALDPSEKGVVEFGGTLVPPGLVEAHAANGNPLRCISMCEALAVLAVVEGELGERLRGRCVWFFVDNTSALWGILKGYSQSAGIARVVFRFWARVAELGARVWMSWVPTKSNFADLPSRLEDLDDVRAATGAAWVELRVPTASPAAAFVGEGPPPPAARGGDESAKRART